MRRAVFLDRDGVLNRTVVRDGVPHPPDDLEGLEILPGVFVALQELAAHGLALVVVTNQPDVARGTQTRQRVEAINAALCEQLPIDAVYVCYHDTADQCACRKPKPGMIHQAAQDHQLDVARSFLVGDRWSDIAAGQAAGCVTLLINEPYSQRERCAPDFVVSGLPEASGVILHQLEHSRI